jgi:large subunit ribosomal protein L22
MLVRAKSKYIRISPYKLRPIVDVVRGLSVDKALALLKNCALKRTVPIQKTIFSAYSNGKNLHSDITSMNELFIKQINVDNGPVIKYYKPGAMGRACIQRKRLSHLQVVLERRTKEKVKA